MTESMSKQGKYWVFTVNNFTKIADFLPEIVKFWAFQHEQGEEGTNHIQGYLQLHTKRRKSTVCKLLEDAFGHSADVRSRKGNHQQALDYVTKRDETYRAGPWMMGVEDKSKPGERTDIFEFKEAIKAGATDRELIENHTYCWLNYQKLIQEMRFILTEEPFKKYPLESFTIPPITDWSTHWLIFGPQDTGKTEFAKAHFENPLVIRHADMLKRFQPGVHDGVIWNEVNITHWPPSAVINLVNKKEQAEVHIRYTVARLPKDVRIIFTANEENVFYQTAEFKRPEAMIIDSINAKVQKLFIPNKIF